MFFSLVPIIFSIPALVISANVSIVCQRGVPVTLIGENNIKYFKACSKNIDCNQGKNGNEFNEHCNEIGPKVCCRENRLKKYNWRCPDRFTLLYNEPKCHDVVVFDEYSGYCPIPGGICFNGYCCPSLIRHDDWSVDLGETLYRTNLPCSPSQPIPLRIPFIFCDYSENRIVVLGKTDLFHRELVWTQKLCNFNEDCSDFEDLVCARKTFTQRCLYNPLHKTHFTLSQLHLVSRHIYISATIAILSFVSIQLLKKYGTF